ncbi:MAG TPA: methyltransferase domain-containing protein [Steroidobacteraceae bacterium]|nr:methyltransferase domain-containing protein [Steroidobacteraceae bacterium]
MSTKQFGASATSYLASPVHAGGADLDRLQELTGKLQASRVLDLGCGAGHASFAMARGGAQWITAFDPSAKMLEVVAREAAGRGHAAIDTIEGSADSLPFEDRTFDLVGTRFSAHHWGSVPRALSECARVLKPAGRMIVIDVVAPEDPVLDTPLQVLEFLRDPSHVRNYRVSEWIGMLLAVGFEQPSIERWKLPLDFASWVARIGTSAARIAALKTVISDLGAEARRYLQVDAALSFAIEAAWMETAAPRSPATSR